LIQSGEKKDNNVYYRLEGIEDLKEAALPTCKWFNCDYMQRK
jgi:hypothetical protein